MGSSGTGIESLLDHPNEPLREVYKQFAREAAAKAGRGNRKRLARLSDLALKVYCDECLNSLRDLPNAQERIADVQARPELRNPLRPEYKVFFQKFLEAVSNESWNEKEQKWLTRLESAEITESTLYGWWKKWNAELKRVLNNEIYQDSDGKLVYVAISPG